MGDEVNDREKQRRKLREEISRTEAAVEKTTSRYLRNDYRKHLKRLRKALASVMVIIILCLMAQGAGRAENEQMWVLCNPESYVVIRERPDKKSAVGGYLYMGDEVQTDGVLRNGYLHLPSVSTEAGEGWVYRGYVDYSEAVRVDQDARTTQKQVRVRGCIDGEVKKRLKKGTVIRVYAENLKWCVTSVGYIRAECLETLAD